MFTFYVVCALARKIKLCWSFYQLLVYSLIVDCDKITLLGHLFSLLLMKISRFYKSAFHEWKNKKENGTRLESWKWSRFSSASRTFPEKYSLLKLIEMKIAAIEISRFPKQRGVLLNPMERHGLELVNYTLEFVLIN